MMTDIDSLISPPIHSTESGCPSVQGRQKTPISPVAGEREFSFKSALEVIIELIPWQLPESDPT
jgi:hypothetical protein